MWELETLVNEVLEGENLRILDRLNEREKLVPYLKIDPARPGTLLHYPASYEEFRLLATKPPEPGLTRDPEKPFFSPATLRKA